MIYIIYIIIINILWQGEITIRVAVVDKEQLCRSEIITFLSPYIDASHIVVSEFQDGRSFVDAAKTIGEFAIAVIDVEMENMNGIDCIKQIREFGHDTIVIFIANNMTYCSHSFRLGAIQYLRKPVSKDDFGIDIKRALEIYKQRNSVYTIKWKSHIYNIKCKDITYIETYQHHLRIYTRKEHFDCNDNLRDVYSLLKPVGFVKTHQGYLVNMDRIKEINQTEVLLDNNIHIPLSRKEKPNVNKIFLCYISRKDNR